MSRYPGTQFKVYDNSQATAIVPVRSTNPADAVKYISTFASVKGPEGINTVTGNEFYDVYGTQDNINFKKYGQPLFQASMNINNGASLISKRAVLDDATLGNATLGVVLTKYRDARVTSDATVDGLIGSISFSNATTAKYSLAPIVFSVDNSNGYAFAETKLNEHKERYDLYKNYIIDVVANEDTPDSRFLSKLINGGGNAGVLSGYAQSIYFDADNNTVDVLTRGKKDVRSVLSITTGLASGNMNTFSSAFDTSDITAFDSNSYSAIASTDAVYTDTSAAATCYTVMEYTVDPTTKVGTWGITDNAAFTDATAPTFQEVAKNIPVERIVTTLPDLYDSVDPSINEDYDNDYPIFGLIMAKCNDTAHVQTATWTPAGEIIDTSSYSGSSVRLMNDLMTSKSGYIITEWVFPMFSIFDNGRSESIKSISIEYDNASSVTLKKAIYKLTVYNYATSKKLESFSFSLNPYTRNNNTGYTFDIESAVNYNSKQIAVKTYYESYDALLETLQEILGSRDPELVGTYDILFGHALNGKYNAYNTYATSSLLNRVAYVYDYAHLDIFDNDAVTVNAYCDCDNMSSDDVTSVVKYYYYNWIRTNKSLIERLEFGSDGYVLDRVDGTGTTKVPFIVVDTSDSKNYVAINELMEETGFKNGAVISSNTFNLNDTPVVPSNFVTVKLYMLKSTKAKRVRLVSGSPTADACNVVLNNNTRRLGNVFLVSNYTDEAAATTAASSYVTTLGGVAVVINDVGLTDTDYEAVNVLVPYSVEKIYQIHYARFFNGEFDKDIFNLDIYFPNAVFDANYDNEVKLAIQRLAAYRGDFMCYMDMGIGKIKSYDDCAALIPSSLGGIDLTSETAQYAYVREMHIAVTCLYYKIRNPYDNRVIEVTGTYGLSNLYIGHFKNNIADVFAGIKNGITLSNIIEGSVNYVPKIYPTSEMTSLNNIGGVYPSDDETIVNEKQLMCDLKVNYGCYYDDRFSIETEFTMNPTESEYSYWNNVALVCRMMQAIRKACPTARYQFVTKDDLTVYKDAVETAMKPWRNKFAKLTFKYVQDDTALENKIFYAAIEVVFKPFAQAEIFELTALNYSTLSTNITGI